MFCKNCGNEVDENAVVCPKCGALVKDIEVKTTSKAEDPAYSKSKTTAGVLFALFLGLIGLIIGVCVYPEGTTARKTFIKAWVITYVVAIAVVVISYIIMAAGVASSVSCLTIG